MAALAEVSAAVPGSQAAPSRNAEGSASSKVPDSSTSVPQSAATKKAAGRQSAEKKLPISVIVLGMAGSGKTTLMRQLNAYARQHSLQPYIINMDPAVLEVPYQPNIDIRDTVNYKEVMKQYSLGPNGGIMTSLNLFTTKFDEVMHLLEKRSKDLDFIFADTPGQIEVFTWSASGSIIAQSLATSFPTVLLYVVDTPRASSCTTFMSNMLYACSILYKMKLPFVIAFNKTDVKESEFAKQWMSDFELFQDALDQEKNQSYYSSLIRSMSLVLEEFYQNMRCTSVSAANGHGMVDLFASISSAAEEYYNSYLPDLKKRMEAIRIAAEKKKNMERVKVRSDLTPAERGDDAESGFTRAQPRSASETGVEPDELEQFKKMMREVHGNDENAVDAAVRRAMSRIVKPSDRETNTSNDNLGGGKKVTN